MTTRIWTAGALALLSVTTTSAGATLPPGGFDRVVALVDTSDSVDPISFATTIRAFAAGLDSLVIRLGVRELEIVPWATGIDCWRSGSLFTLPARHDREQTAAPAAPREPQLYRALAERRVQETAEANRRKQAAVDSLYQTRLAEALAQVRERLERLRLAQPPNTPPCTALVDALSRAAAERDRTLVVLITDLDERWRCPSKIANIPPPRQTVATAVVIVPRISELAPIDNLTARIRWLGLVAGWAHWLPSIGLDPSARWLDLATPAQ